MDDGPDTGYSQDDNRNDEDWEFNAYTAACESIRNTCQLAMAQDLEDDQYNHLREILVAAGGNG